MYGNFHGYILIISNRELNVINSDIILLVSMTLLRLNQGYLYVHNLATYCIAGKFGEAKVWRIYFYKVFDEEKFKSSQK